VERISTQISGERVRRSGSWAISGRLEASQVTSTALTPSCGGNWAINKDEALREQLGQKTADGKLTARVAESWRRTHEDASEAIGLDPVREPGERGVSQDLGPAIQVEPRLRCKVR